MPSNPPKKLPGVVGQLYKLASGSSNGMTPMHGGMGPEIMLCEMSIILKCWRWHRFEEICPSNLFPLNKSTLI
jgi:hypothetical protein